MLGFILFGTNDADTIRGGAWDDYISGRSGKDKLFSGEGSDTVRGGQGDDWIYNDKGNDKFFGEGGSDTISFAFIKASKAGVTFNESGVVFDLTKTSQSVFGFGTDTYSGFENIEGGWGPDILYGDARNNVIGGGDGNDQLYGRDGNDVIRGGAGADTIIGGKGGDRLGGFGTDLSGGDFGSDIFRFTSREDSGTGASNRDEIWGSFNGGTSDRIDLRTIDANGTFAAGDGVFKFIGDKAFKAGVIGEVQVKHLGGKDFRVSIDLDQDNGAEMILLVHSSSGKLVAGDFIL